MGFSLDISVPALTVFLQGLLSFFSPCVLPLAPLYLGYLSGGARTTDEDGTVHYDRKKVMVRTLFFVLGISAAFFILGLGVTAAGQFLNSYRSILVKIGGIIIIFFGLYQLGLFGGGVLSKEHRLPFALDRFTMNPLTALLLGFTFSFAWTPCVGPALTSVLLMASSSSSSALGFALIGLYTLGFVIPFLALGLFTSSVLNFFKNRQKVVRYTVKIGGAIMILMGVMMLTGWMNGITGYLSRVTGSVGETTAATTTAAPATTAAAQATTVAAQATTSASQETTTAAQEEETDVVAAPDFTLVDQNGTTHTLSDYKGKVVFLNFWATWCGPCRNEMPDIQALYEDHGLNKEDVIVLGVANPASEEYPYNQDDTAENIAAFLSRNSFTYPVVMDTTGAVFQAYGVTSFPTTFMIDADGNAFGYVTGTISQDVMDSIVKQTQEGKRTD